MTACLCETIAVPTVAALRQARDGSAADLVELRLDALRERIDVAAALAGRRKPVIVTCRPTWEGGSFEGSEEERARILADALALGAEWIDVEWRARLEDLVRRGGARVVLSMHDFQGVPSDLMERCREMRQAAPSGVIKVAVMPHALGELVELAEVSGRLNDARAVFLGMGEFGVVSRLLPVRFHSSWTYAGDGIAPGQLPVARMVDEFGVRRVSAGAAIYGIVGRPVTWSLSPAMHNAAFRAAHIDAIYVPLPATSVDDFVGFADSFGVVGASVTIPFKVDALAIADELDPICRRIGAVNTLKRQAGRWLAVNTDVAGFLAPLERRMKLAGTRASLLGAGGAARAVAAGLAAAGARVTVHARRAEQARAVAEMAGGVAGAWPPAPGTWDLLVNTTPVGSAPAIDRTPFGGPFTGRLVYDLVYQPQQTRLLRDASRAGCEIIGGLEMLVAQAQAQSEWWTGVRPPESLLRDAALARLPSERPITGVTGGL